MAGAEHVDIAGILSMLPHRYPFLLVDRVLEHERETSILALKNVTINEPFFQGHFPGRPIMPGVLILEALAQAGALCAFLDAPETMAGKLFLFTGMDKVRFRKTVEPGDQLMLECRDFRKKLGLLKMTAKATVDGALAAEAELMAMIAPKTKAS
ncbi:MAG: 3-hydroxyacyl-ACP dehydratase FabZ [Desulfovibrionaceae bacterium]|nr:3-hydroxyacyl-ACP dehydratase FabZ [Desulfovibrionaceae bacterium]MBF0512705.1 3-hydroxyacyl-ACP dehydratase FabZ [Desulfovibrionaceae bacterium]